MRVNGGDPYNQLSSFKETLLDELYTSQCSFNQEESFNEIGNPKMVILSNII